MTESHIARSLAQREGTTVVITTSPLLLAACDRVVDLPDDARIDADA
ncbi:hypothetical protein [Microbacterium hominis]|nr:hypothetical protein [Microbacterium hominis]